MDKRINILLEVISQNCADFYAQILEKKEMFGY